MSLPRRLQLITPKRDWTDNALKVAFATDNREVVNQHFGAAQAFAIYCLDEQQVAFMELVSFEAEAMDGNEDKLTPKINALEGCVAVYSQAVGASAINQLKAKGIQAMKVPPNSDIKRLLQGLQQELRTTPSPWLARALQGNGPADPKRFDEMEAQGWEE